MQWQNNAKVSLKDGFTVSRQSQKEDFLLIIYYISLYIINFFAGMSGIPIKNHKKKPQAFLKESETNLREIAQN